MPPANGNGVRGKGAYHNGVPLPRPVPAIPLPYLRRNNKAGTAKQQQQQQQPQEHSQSQSLAPSTATAWQPDTRDQATRTPKVTPKDPESAQSTTESAAGDTSANGIPKTEDVSAQEVVDGRANGTASSSIDLQTAESNSVASSDRTSPNPDRPTATPSQSESSNANSSDEMNGQDTTASSLSAHQTNSHIPMMPSHMRAAGYRMPPPFHPQPSHNTHDRSGGPHHPVIVGNQAPITHHPQPSSGSVQFGGFNGSNTSSPGPNSAGFAPPPGPPASGGRTPYMGRGPATADVHTTSIPFGNEFEPPTSMDPFRQTMMGIHSPEGYPPYMMTYGPPTPHSYHGSQSSAHAEEAGAFGHYSPAPATNGQPENHARGHSSAMFGMPPPMRMMGAMPPPHMVQPMMDPDASEFFTTMRGYFQDSQFADCTLELRFSDEATPSFKMPGHRLILSQSEPLQKLLAEQMTSTASSNLITLDIADSHVRPDSLVMALQRLYGYPLFSIPTPPPGSDDLPLAGSPVDRFGFVLGYAASGHVLGRRSIVVRGMELAAQLLSWDTLEMALEFVLGSSDSRGTIDLHNQWPYGESTRILVDGIVNYVASNLPLDFTLNVAAEDPKGYCRLPFVAGAAKPVPASDASGPGHPKRNRPQIARGTSVHLKGQGSRSRVSGIKFGDLSLEEGAEPTTPRTDQSQSPHHLVLSRVLFNLPFVHLKSVLEAGGVGGDTDESRRRLANDIVSERETRRLAALEAIKAGGAEDFRPARQSLSLIEPRLTDQWAVLGFREFVQRYRNSNAPYLGRSWNPVAWGDRNGSPHTSPTTMAYP